MSWSLIHNLNIKIGFKLMLLTLITVVLTLSWFDLLQYAGIASSLLVATYIAISHSIESKVK
jgi:hypothetical protein